MPKEIVLLTIPHTGTYTLFYLFHMLGGIPTWWGHFERHNSDAVRRVVDVINDESRFVHVQSWRDEADTRKSHAQRAEDGGRVFLQGCYDTRLKYVGKLPPPIIVPIGYDALTMTTAAEAVFEACGVEPTPEAREFMRTWPAINDFAGENQVTKKVVRERLPDRHIGQLAKEQEKDNGT